MQKIPEDQLPHPSRIAVRINNPHTPFFERDVFRIVRPPFSINRLAWVERVFRSSAHYSRRSDAGVA